MGQNDCAGGDHTPAGVSPLARTDNQGIKSLVKFVFPGVVLAGLFFRLLVVVVPGNAMRSPWSGGSDSPAYITLAQNLVAGRGYGYAGWPTAFRPPAYPLILAASMEVFGENYIVAVRGVQFLQGLLVAFLCAAAAGKIFGDKGKRATLVVALFFPTLVVVTSEIVSESTAIAIFAVFLYLLVRYVAKPSLIVLVALAVVAGLAVLVRFNMAILGFVLLGVVLSHSARFLRWRNAAVAILVSGVVVSPWLIRNLMVFRGTVLLSTQSGFAAVSGVLVPQGRSQPGDTEKLRSNLGWALPQDLETNGPNRALIPAEPVLDRNCWKLAFRLWRQARWKLVPLTLGKLSYFWLSTDQLFWTGSLRPLARIVRAGGVFTYWILLAFGVLGWLQLRIRKPELAQIFLLYVVLVTVLHIPFNMNTRYRIPFIDPLVAILVGAAGTQEFRGVISKATGSGGEERSYGG